MTVRRNKVLLVENLVKNPFLPPLNGLMGEPKKILFVVFQCLDVLRSQIFEIRNVTKNKALSLSGARIALAYQLELP